MLGKGQEVKDEGGWTMAALSVPATMVNFRDEARGCLELAKAETQREVRTILMGMALGWLTLASHVKSDALQLELER
jgi:hypothetical protein